MSSKNNRRRSNKSASPNSSRIIRDVPSTSPAVPRRVHVSTMSASLSPPSSPDPDDQAEKNEVDTQAHPSCPSPCSNLRSRSARRVSQSVLNPPPKIIRKVSTSHPLPEKKQKTSVSSDVLHRVMFARELVHPSNPLSHMDQSLLCESISNVLEPIVQLDEDVSPKNAHPHTNSSCLSQNDKAGELDNPDSHRGVLEPFRTGEPGPSSPCGPYETHAFTETHSAAQFNSNSVRSELSLGRSSNSWRGDTMHPGASTGPDSFGPHFGSHSSTMDDELSFLDDCFPNDKNGLSFQCAPINRTDGITTDKGKCMQTFFSIYILFIGLIHHFRKCRFRAH